MARGGAACRDAWYAGAVRQRPDHGPGEIAGGPGEVERVASGRQDYRRNHPEVRPVFFYGAVLRISWICTVSYAHIFGALVCMYVYEVCFPQVNTGCPRGTSRHVISPSRWSALAAGFPDCRKVFLLFSAVHVDTKASDNGLQVSRALLVGGASPSSWQELTLNPYNVVPLQGRPSCTTHARFFRYL